MRLADAGRRAASALDRYYAAIIGADPARRPREIGDGWLAVDARTWNSHAAAREAVAALIALAVESDVEGR